jgi:hypothetical protein
MPLLLRIIMVGVFAYLAGSTLTPLLWGPVLAQQSKQILSPFAVLSAAIFIIAVVFAVREWRRK